jgi:hypothetical protein
LSGNNALLNKPKYSLSSIRYKVLLTQGLWKPNCNIANRWVTQARGRGKGAFFDRRLMAQFKALLRAEYSPDEAKIKGYNQTTPDLVFISQGGQSQPRRKRWHE